jgi:putative inorganic carbon (HCO3(-)) transporter
VTTATIPSATPLPALQEQEVRREPRSQAFFAVFLLASVLFGMAGLVTGSMLPFALQLAAGLAILVVGQPRAATLLFIFILHMNVAVVLTTYHGVPQILASATTLLLIVPLAAHIVLRREPLVVTPALPLILLYLAALLLSTVFSGTSDIKLSTSAITNFLSEGLLLYFLITNVIRSAAIIRQVIWVLLFAGALMGAISIWQEATKSYGNDLAGFAQVNEGGFKVGETLEGKVLRNRLTGPIGEQNRYAQVLLVLAPLALFRFFGEEKRSLRLLAAGAGVLILSGVLLSFSRGAAVAVACCLLALVVLREVRLRQVLMISAVVVGAVLLIAPDYIIRLSSLQGAQSLAGGNAQEADNAIVGRAQSNIAAWNTFVDHPALGVGPMQFFRNYSYEAGQAVGLKHREHDRRAHNLYLEMAADLGIVGLGAFLSAVGVTMVQLLRLRARWRETRPDLANLATTMILSLVAYLSSALFLHLSYQRYYWELLAIANGVIWVLMREPRPDAGSAPRLAVATP